MQRSGELTRGYNAPNMRDRQSAEVCRNALTSVILDIGGASIAAPSLPDRVDTVSTVYTRQHSGTTWNIALDCTVNSVVYRRIAGDKLNTAATQPHEAIPTHGLARLDVYVLKPNCAVALLMKIQPSAHAHTIEGVRRGRTLMSPSGVILETDEGINPRQIRCASCDTCVSQAARTRKNKRASERQDSPQYSSEEDSQQHKKKEIDAENEDLPTDKDTSVDSSFSQLKSEIAGLRIDELKVTTDASISVDSASIQIIPPSNGNKSPKRVAPLPPTLTLSRTEQSDPTTTGALQADGDIPKYRSTLSFTPIRVVQERRIQAGTTAMDKLEKTGHLNALEAQVLASMSGAGQVSGIKSSLTTDNVALGMLGLATNQEGNVSPDVSPILRAILYTYPAGIPSYGSIEPLRRIFCDVGATSPQNWAGEICPFDAGPGGAKPSIKIMATNITSFTALVMGKDINPWASDVTHPFSPSKMDITWAAVPISTEILRSGYAAEWIVAHIDNIYWYGRTNFHVSASVPVPGVAKTHDQVQATYMPQSHNVRVVGTTGVMLVLNDFASTQVRGSLTISPGGVTPLENPLSLPIYTHETATPPVVNDFFPTLDYIFSTAQYSASASRMLGALNMLTLRMAGGMSGPIAFAMAAELCAVLPMNPYIKSDGRTYQSQVAARGYSICPFDMVYTDGGGLIKTSDMHSVPIANKGRRMSEIVGGALLSSLAPTLTLPCAIATVKTLDVTKKNAAGDPEYQRTKIWVPYDATHSTVHSSRYASSSASSIVRVLRFSGLLQVNDYIIASLSVDTLYARIHVHGTAIGLAFTSFLTTNDLSLPIWNNTNTTTTNYYPPDVTSSYEYVSAGRLLYVSFGYWSRDVRVTVDGQETTVASLLYAYNSDLVGGKQWASNIPIPHWAYTQWLQQGGYHTATKFPAPSYLPWDETTYVSCMSFPPVGEFSSPYSRIFGTPDVTFLAPVAKVRHWMDGASWSCPLSMAPWYQATSFNKNPTIVQDQGVWASDVLCVTVGYATNTLTNEAKILVNNKRWLDGSQGGDYTVTAMSVPDPVVVSQVFRAPAPLSGAEALTSRATTDQGGFLVSEKARYQVEELTTRDLHLGPQQIAPNPTAPTSFLTHEVAGTSTAAEVSELSSDTATS